MTRNRNHDLQPGGELRAEPLHTRLSSSAAAGLLAGTFVGLVEVVLLVVLGGGPSRLHALFWALVAYGLFGLPLGMLIGVVLVVVRRGMDRGPTGRCRRS